MLIACSGCTSTLRVPDDAVGKTVQCPTCSTLLVVPASTAISTTPPTPSSTPTSSRGGEVTASPPAAASDRPAPATPPRYDDDDDIDVADLNVRQDGQQINSYAMTAMVLGIVSLSVASVGVCCCGAFAAIIAMITGGLAIYFGIMGKVPGSENYAKTGIICGSAAVGIAAIALIALIVILGINIGMNGRFP